MGKGIHERLRVRVYTGILDRRVTVAEATCLGFGSLHLDPLTHRIGILQSLLLFFPSFLFLISEPVLFFESLLDCFILGLDELFISLHV